MTEGMLIFIIALVIFQMTLEIFTSKQLKYNSFTTVILKNVICYGIYKTIK